ncbi:MAG: hypothetical protein Q8896_07930, partial [Bacteroidota bacterium]|nr:hypothetical protein [Bacteroidota bacterium]
DPTYVALAEIRFADYHQVEPIQIYMYPQNATAADSGSKTPTAMTYGLVTPYFNDLPTNRTSGMTYHLVAMKAGTRTVVADGSVTLMPGDKKTWLISGDGGTFDATIINDNPPANQDQNLAYFRFLNVDPDHEPQGLTIMVGDPLNGMHLADAQHYKTASDYKGIHVSFTATTPPVAIDTSITFYVVDPSNGAVLSRLSGVGLAAGTYHTLTWGGATVRIPDPITGNLTGNDTVRIRILDDDPGTDITLTPPLTFKYNIVNALIPPSYPNANFIDYSSTGLNIILNNNTTYDYQGVMPFTVVPSPIASTPNADGAIFNSVPATATLVDVMYYKLVKPFAQGKNPSALDTILFRFYAGSPRSSIKSDAMYTIVVFDSTKNRSPKTTDPDYSAPYDSSGGTLTVPIPDVPVAGAARIVIGNMLANLRTGASTNKGKFYVHDSLITKVTVFKSYDSSIVVPAGMSVTIKATIGTDPDYTYTFTPEAGGIYEAFLVGKRDHPNPAYHARFIVARVNPIQ